jgi:Flp pilus assembly protein TadG
VTRRILKWTRARKARGERGATLIEAVIMLPLFFFLIFGILEFGFAFRNYLTLANGTRDAARTGTTAGNVADADFRILEAVESSMSAMSQSDIERIVVFRATGPNDTAPALCRSGTAQTGADACNVYTTANFNNTASQFDCAGAGTAPDNFWCPVSRKVAVRGTNGPPDYIGIWIQVKYDYITGLFPGDGMTFTDTTIMRIEPRTVE